MSKQFERTWTQTDDASILPNTIRHPHEEQSLNAVMKNKGIDLFMRFFTERFSELTELPEILNRSMPVSALTQPRLWKLYHKAKTAIGIPHDVPLFVTQDFGLNVEVLGSNEACLIMITDACVDTYSDTQLIAALGHALTHIRLGHVTLLNFSRSIGNVLESFPAVGKIARVGLEYSLLEWQQDAEYSADRGGAYAAGQGRSMLESIGLAMGMDIKRTDISLRFPDSLTTVQRIEDLSRFGKITLTQSVKEMEVPFGAIRMRELWNWLQSGDCCGLKYDFLQGDGDARFLAVIQNFCVHASKSNHLLCAVDGSISLKENVPMPMKALRLPAHEKIYVLEWGTQNGNFSILTEQAIYLQRGSEMLRIALSDFLDPNQPVTLEISAAEKRLLYQNCLLVSTSLADEKNSLLAVLVSLRQTFCPRKGNKPENGIRPTRKRRTNKAGTQLSVSAK